MKTDPYLWRTCFFISFHKTNFLSGLKISETFIYYQRTSGKYSMKYKQGSIWMPRGSLQPAHTRSWQVHLPAPTTSEQQSSLFNNPPPLVTPHVQAAVGIIFSTLRPAYAGMPGQNVTAEGRY